MLEPALAAAHQDVLFFEAGGDRGGEGRVGRAGVDGVPAGHHTLPFTTHPCIRATTKGACSGALS
jgi:hypothetical protein